MPRSHRLLVVESDADLLSLTCDLLTTTGFHTTPARDVEEASRLLTQSGFDLVLADLYLDTPSTEMAWSAIHRLASIAGPIPIGVVTGAPIAPPLAAEHAAARDVAFVIRKPVSMHTLLDAIQRTLALPPVPDHLHHVVRAYFAAIERGDWDQLASLCMSDVRYRVPSEGNRLGSVIHGRAALRELARDTFRDFKDPRFFITAIRPLPTGALIRYDVTWLGKDAVRQSHTGAVLFQFTDSAISEIDVRLAPIT